MNKNKKLTFDKKETGKLLQNKIDSMMLKFKISIH